MPPTAKRIYLKIKAVKKEAKKSALFGQEISPVATCDLWLRPKNPQTFIFSNSFWTI